MTKDKLLLAALLAPLALLLVPLIAMRFSAEVNWTALDFVFAYVVLAGAGLTFWAINRRAPNWTYRFATALAVGASLALVWVNLAVGFIGEPSNPANALYFLVLALLATSGVLVRFAPAGLARVLFATAVAQFAVPIVAWFAWPANFDVPATKIFVLNFLWVAAFAAAGGLYRQAARAAAGA